MKVIQHCKLKILRDRRNLLFFSRLGDKLWRAPGDDLAVSQLSNLWRSTLSKKGCFTLMKSGMFVLNFII
jgi:hypothetical protein